MTDPVQSLDVHVNELEKLGEKQSTALVIVTYNRSDYLVRLLDSIGRLSDSPDMVIIVDNASTDNTTDVIKTEQKKSHDYVIIHDRLADNQGGSGGFHAGVRRALFEGAQWLWIMDDDIELLPEGLSRMKLWSSKYKCFMGRRYDHDGSEFHWQPRLNTWLGVPLPYIGRPFLGGDTFLTNCGCFEGMFIHRSIIEQIGLPDERFFITWDDVIYGWLASRVTEVALVNSFVIQRARPQRQISLGIRHLNDASNLSRFYIMANRGHVAQYLRHKNAYNKFGFALGTALVFFKEIVRLVAVERTLKGSKYLFDGWKHSLKIRQDKNWKMP